MANATDAFGLRPVRYLDGTPYSGASTRCYISSSYATALYVGDPVIITDEADYMDTTAKCISIEKADGADGTPIFGVIIGFDFDPDNPGRNYNPASTARYCKVCTDPNVVYQIRDDGGLTPSKSNFIALNGVIDVTGSGSTVTGLSGALLDTDDPPAADASNPLFILGLAPIEDNELAVSAVWEVIISNHRLANDGAAVGRVVGVAAS
jgi:hypothetical protein